MPKVGADVYRRFAAIWANGEPVRNANELHALLRAGGLSEAEASDEWLRSLPRAWVYGEVEDPFVDEQSNRVYRRELGQ